MKLALILLDGKARTNVLLSTFKERIVDMDSIVLLLFENKDLLSIEKRIDANSRILIIYAQEDMSSEHYSGGRALVHELNNSLAIIFSSLFISKKLLKKETVDMEKIEKMLVDISSTSENIQKIIKGYSAELEGNTISYEMEATDLTYYIENTIVPFLMTNKVEYELNINIPTDQKYKLKTTGIHASQFIINLVKNACEAVSEQEDRKIILSAEIRNENDFFLEVSDNGPGVPEDHINQIFKQNFSTKGDKGNGTGLYICRKNIIKSNGTMSYDRTFKGGAKFIVSLPVEKINE